MFVNMNKKQLYSNPKNFVFEKNYPNLSLGPSSYVRKELADKSSPKDWINKDFREMKKEKNSQIIVYNNFNKNLAKKPSNSLEKVQLLSQAVKTTEIEATINNKFTKVVDDVSGVNNYGFFYNGLKIVDNIRIPKIIDKTVNDKDLKAVGGVINIYDKIKDVYKIQDVFSVGLLGVNKNRVLVPTKWTITSVDDIVSKNIILEKIIYYPTIDEYFVFTYKTYKNKFVILLLPSNWGFENIEVGKDLVVMKDYEINYPRKKYATSVTGGYYATRLSVCEYLSKIKKQAKAIVFREIDIGYKSEGVWLVRESVKKAFENKPKAFEDLSSAFKEISKHLEIGFGFYLKQSVIVDEYKKQKKIFEFI